MDIILFILFTSLLPYAISKAQEMLGYKHDPYKWMRDARVQSEGMQANPDIHAHILQECLYAQSILEPLLSMQQKLQDEMSAMMLESAYSQEGYETAEYSYYARVNRGQYYPTYYYKSKTTAEAPEVEVLDVNKLVSEAGSALNISKMIYINPQHSKVAYHMNDGGDVYMIKVLDLVTNTYNDEISNTLNDNIVWKKDGSGFFYTQINPDTLGTDCVKYHSIGSDVNSDRIVVKTPDSTINVTIDDHSGEYLFVAALSSSAREVWMVSLENEEQLSKLIQPRQEGVAYKIGHYGEYLYMVTNQDHSNLGIKRCAVTDLDKRRWEDYISPDLARNLDDVQFTKGFVILKYRDSGLDLIKVHNLNDDTETTISLKDIAADAAYVVKVESVVAEENKISISYSSLARPKTIYEFDCVTKGLTLLTISPTSPTYNPDLYTVERIWADNEGVMVPISLVYKTESFKHDGSNPLYMEGYGAGGRTKDPEFCAQIIPLLDRGFVYAIAHVRGGADLGVEWYKSGTLLNKKNTFEDFIKCTEKLIAEHYTSAGNIVAMGGSSGGLLVGAVANMRPDLYKVIVANVPFVDALNTMLDATLPLTEVMWDEFGNPNEPQYYKYMKSYSPYDNVQAQNYPHMYVTAGLSDQRVGYWEPMKWVAKLREMKTDDNQIVLRILYGGHNCGNRIDHIALEYAFILEKFGIRDDVANVDYNAGVIGEPSIIPEDLY